MCMRMESQYALILLLRDGRGLAAFGPNCVVVHSAGMRVAGGVARRVSQAAQTCCEDDAVACACVAAVHDGVVWGRYAVRMCSSVRAGAEP